MLLKTVSVILAFVAAASAACKESGAPCSNIGARDLSCCTQTCTYPDGVCGSEAEGM